MPGLTRGTGAAVKGGDRRGLVEGRFGAAEGLGAGGVVGLRL